MKNQFKYCESGRTMLEMLGVLGIMGIIMYGAVAGINYGMSTYKINQTYNEIQEAIQGIQDLYSWSRSYDGITIGTLCDNDIFANCTTGDSTVTNAFGGAIQVQEDGSSFKLTYSISDDASLNRLMEMEWGTIKCTQSSSSLICQPNDDT